MNCTGLCIPIPKGHRCLNKTDLISTPFANGTVNGTKCSSELFDCKLPEPGWLCIDMDFVCDGFKHCLNGSDEDTSPNGPCGKIK